MVFITRIPPLTHRLSFTPFLYCNFSDSSAFINGNALLRSIPPSPKSKLPARKSSSVKCHPRRATLSSAHRAEKSTHAKLNHDSYSGYQLPASFHRIISKALTNLHQVSLGIAILIFALVFTHSLRVLALAFSSLSFFFMPAIYRQPQARFPGSLGPEAPPRLPQMGK